MTEEQVGIKMRLIGANEYVAGMERGTEATVAYGDSAERAGAQAKGASVGIDAMAASSSKGVGALTKMKKAGDGMKSTGSKLTSAWTVPIALIGGVGVKMAIDFSDAMEQISTQAGASQKEVGIMTRKVEAFAASGKSDSGPKELAEGLYSIESAGFRGNRAFEALVKSEQLATVGHADFGKTSKAVAAAMATQIKGTENLGETVGLMNSIVGIGSMKMEDLLSAMGTGLLDKSAGLGLSLQEVGAALGVLTTTGTPAAASSTRMAMAFNMMAAPTEKAAKAMESLGLTESQLAMNMRKKGLVSTIEMLKGKLDSTFGTNKAGLVKQSKAISEMFGGGRTSGGIISLMRHIDMLKSKTGELSGSEEKFKQALEHTDAQPIVKLRQAWAQLQVVLIQIGNALIPVVIGIAHFFVGAAHWFDSLPGPAKDVLMVLAGVLAVAGPLLYTIGTMTELVYLLATAFGALDISMAGIPLLIGATAAVIVGLTGFMDGGASAGDRLADTSKRLTKYMTDQRTAGQNLVTSEHALSQSKKRSKNAAHAFSIAQGRVNEAVSKYGAGSKPAIHAEQMLAQKRWSVVRATKAVKNAEREHGVALQMTKQLTRSALLEARHEINQLKMKNEQFDELFSREKKSGAGAERLNQIAEWGTKVNDKLSKAHKKQNEVILEASKKIGPAYAQWLHTASHEMLTFGSEMGVVNDKFKKAMELSERMSQIMEQERPAPGSGNPFHKPAFPGHGPHHKQTSTGGGGPDTATVSLLRTRSGPSTTRLNTRRKGGAGSGRKGKPVAVTVPVYIARRKFGEGMSIAMIDDKENE